MKKVNAWICALLTTDHDPASVFPDKKRKSLIFVILCGPIVFWELITAATIFSFFFYLRNGLQENLLNKSLEMRELLDALCKVLIDDGVISEHRLLALVRPKVLV